MDDRQESNRQCSAIVNKRYDFEVDPEHDDREVAKSIWRPNIQSVTQYFVYCPLLLLAHL